MNFKKITIYMMVAMLASCSPKTGLMVTKDKDGTKMLVGLSDKNALMNDPAFGWFRQGYERYKPDPIAIRTISQQASALHIEAFGGTWCSDTHELLPEFYKAMDAAKVSDAQISLHLVNRDKKTGDGSAEKYHITNVPTFIIMKGDKQLGKVVESTKGTIEADIAAMLIDKD
jgi:hypothetical protein